MALPADKTTMLEEIMQRKADRFEAWEDTLWEEGLAIYGKAKPMDRLRWYMQQTLPQDFGMVLDLDYRDKRERNEVGPLQVEVLFEQYKQDAQLVVGAQQEAEAAGMPMQAPPIEPPPMMWVQLMGMSPRFMRKVQSDFRALLNEQGRREGLTTTQPVESRPQEMAY